MTVELRQGEVVAQRYRLDQRLGEGGMGVVWAATHTRTDKKVALKFVKRAHDSSDVSKRFLREARAACAVTHANVRDIHDILELEDGSPVMVMEYLIGESLAQRLDREGKLPLEQAAAILVQIVSAVGAAHASGIVHRDLKPENVFLTRGPPSTVKVLDFGIAKLAPAPDGADETKLTHSGAMLGTPCYMSPEQVFGEKDIDHRADIWALGLIAYRMLSGVLPTQADNVGQVMKIIVTKSVRPLDEVVPGVPSEVCAIVNRMLARDLEERPESLLEVQTVLAKFTAERAPGFAAPVRRRTSAPALEGSTASAAGESTLETSEPGGASSSPARSRVSTEDPDATMEALEEVPVAARGDSLPLTTPVRRRPRAVALGAIVIAIAGVSIGMWSRFGSSAGAVAPAAPNVPVTEVVTPNATEPAPEPSAALAPPATSVERTVSVAIEPPGATVHVGGAEQQVKDGSVAITGLPGSRHEVRVVAGKRSKTTEIVITQDGAFPAKVSVGDAPRATASTPRATASVAPTPAPRATTAPQSPVSPAPKPFQESEKFE